MLCIQQVVTALVHKLWWETMAKGSSPSPPYHNDPPPTGPNKGARRKEREQQRVRLDRSSDAFSDCTPCPIVGSQASAVKTLLEAKRRMSHPLHGSDARIRLQGELS